MTGEQFEAWLELHGLSTSEFAKGYNEAGGTSVRSTYINEMVSGKRELSNAVKIYIQLLESKAFIAELKEKIVRLS